MYVGHRKENKVMINVTAVIPVFDGQDHLGWALDSILRQTILPREVVIVDDCSTDDTLSVALDFASRFLEFGIRFVVYRACLNHGAGASRNKGWALSTSDFICFLDADDQWLPMKLEVQYDFMRKSSVDLCCHLDMFHPLQSANHSINLPVRVRSCRISFYAMLFRNVVRTRTVMLRRSLSQRFSLSKFGAEDFELWLKLLNSKKEVRLLKFVGAIYFKPNYGDAGISKNLKEMHLAVTKTLGSLKVDNVFVRSLVWLAVRFEKLKYILRNAVVWMRRQQSMRKN